MADRQPLSTDVSDATPTGKSLLTAADPAAARATIGAEAVEAGRDVAFADGSTAGAVTVPVQTNATLTNGVWVGVPGGGGKYITIAELEALIAPSGYSAKINDELGSTTWQQGGVAGSPPSQIDSASWAFNDLASDGDGQIVITTLPSPGSAAINAGQYRLDSGTAASIPGFTNAAGTFNIAASNAMHTCELRFSNDAGTTWGPWSATKSKLITAPSYVPTIVDNQGNAYIQAPPNSPAGNTSYCTIALHGKIIGGGLTTGLKEILTTSADRCYLTYNYINDRVSLRLRNASAVVIFEAYTEFPRDTYHTIVFSIALTATPSVQIYKDGIALANTGDPATGYVVTTAAAPGTIEYDRASGVAHTWFGDTLDIHVGEAFLDITQAINPALFHTGASLVDWNSLAAAALFYMGSNMSAAQWNAAEANNIGYQTPLTNFNTFIAV